MERRGSARACRRVNVSRFWNSTRIVISTATVARLAVSPERRTSGMLINSANSAAARAEHSTATIGPTCRSASGPGMLPSSAACMPSTCRRSSRRLGRGRTASTGRRAKSESPSIVLRSVARYRLADTDGATTLRRLELQPLRRQKDVWLRALPKEPLHTRSCPRAASLRWARSKEEACCASSRVRRCQSPTHQKWASPRRNR